MSRPSLILAIETSNPSTFAEVGGAPSHPGPPGIALLREEQGGAITTLGVEPVRAGGAFDDDLAAAIDRLMSTAGHAPRDLDRVALSVGPGGFTGLRIAAATTLCICEATGAEAVAVPTALGVLARVPAQLRADRTCVIGLAWKRHDFWREVFPPFRGGVDRSVAAARRAALVTIDDAFADLHSAARTLVADQPLLELLKERICIPADVHVVPPVFDPVAIGEVSLALDPIDPLRLAPLYPREPEAVTKWRRRS